VGVVDRTADDDTEQWRSAMVDVSGLSLTELAERARTDSVLGSCLNRMAEDDDGEPIAGFNSAL
jgi:FXSXX-COOH protein